MTLAARFTGKKYTLTLDEPAGGSVRVTPEIRPGKTYPAHTMVTVTAVPDEVTTPSFERELTSDMRVGASFIPKEDLEGIRVIQDIIYARPGIKPLKYDVYSPVHGRNLSLFTGAAGPPMTKKSWGEWPGSTAAMGSAETFGESFRSALMAAAPSYGIFDITSINPSRYGTIPP